VNQALNNCSIDEAIDGSIRSKKFGWIKKTLTCLHSFEKSHKSISEHKKNNNVMILNSDVKVFRCNQSFTCMKHFKSNDHGEIRRNAVVFGNFSSQGEMKN
jgi:hypothetical protein